MIERLKVEKQTTKVSDMCNFYNDDYMLKLYYDVLPKQRNFDRWECLERIS